MKNYTFKSTLGTIKKATTILENIGLEAIVLGGEFNIEPDNLIQKLLKEDLVNEFFRTVTGLENEDFEEFDILEVEQLAINFFEFLLGHLGKLKLLNLLKETQTNTPETSSTTSVSSSGSLESVQTT